LAAQIRYDIGIWEQVKSDVQWEISRLLSEIKIEISKDRTLREFQCGPSVQWQLQQIVAQRADTWIQRIYDVCCDAYTRSGKPISEDFDRSMWAYCIEPFVTGNQETYLQTMRSTDLLELLLCAVGSPPEIRRSLRVSEKNCCFAIRGEF